MQGIDSHCAVCYHGGAEGRSVQRADDGKDYQRAAYEIQAAEQERHAVEEKQDAATVETIDEIAAEGAYEHDADGVAREHKAYRVLARTVCVAEIDREDGHDEHEGEI